MIKASHPHKVQSWSSETRHTQHIRGAMEPQTIFFTAAGVFLMLLVDVAGELKACERGTRLFHYINTPKTWSEAQGFCRANYAGLVTLNSMGEHVQLVQSIPHANVSGIWIGMERSETERWVWSEGVGEVAAVFSWEIGKEYGDCVQMEPNGSWAANQCSDQKAFLCFDCDSNGLERYFLYTQNMSWRDAQLYCRQNHTDLVSVKTKQQNVEIQDQAKGNTIWIGLIREGWMWSDGSQTSFRNWDESSPDNGGGAQNCVAILKSLQHQWDDSTCDVSYPFFCQGELKTKTTVVKVRISAGVNLDNERESLLKQIQAQLEAQGLMGVKVRWRTDANNQVVKQEKDDGPDKQVVEGRSCQRL